MNSRRASNRATIRDVARLAGVAPATVSQVLSGRKGYASSETAQRILDAVERLDYRPNRVAQSLVTARSYTIGLVISSITRPHFSQVVAGIEEVVRELGYSVLLICARDVDAERAAVRTFRDKCVDGIVFMTTSQEQKDLAFISETAQSCLVVAINRPLNDPAVHEILWDDVAIGRMATEHLIALGHRRIAHLAGVLDPPEHGYRAAVERLTGYEEALSNAAVAVERQLVIRSGYSYEAGLDAVGHLLELGDLPTAVFAVDDIVAAAVMNGLQRAGYKVPQDMSVVGAGGAHDGFHTEPPLTTVYMPVFEAGQRAARYIIDALERGTPAVSPREVLSPTLLVRGSTCSPPNPAPRR